MTTQDTTVHAAVPAYKMYALGMFVALVGMQLDLRYHEWNVFETYLTWQHGIIYAGITIFGFAVISRFYYRRKFGMKMDRPSKLALIGFVVMLGSGVADGINHTFIIHGFDKLLTWSHFPFVAGMVIASFAAMWAVRGTKLEFIGYGLLTMSVLAFGFMVTTHTLPHPPLWSHTVMRWISVFTLWFWISNRNLKYFHQ
jgi:hypothetical protein